MDRSVHYVCVADDHQQVGLFDSESPWAPNVLQFNEGYWSYCPAGEPKGHRWSEVSPRRYDELRDEVEERIRGTT